jgi:hypothetical protein
MTPSIEPENTTPGMSVGAAGFCPDGILRANRPGPPTRSPAPAQNLGSRTCATSSARPRQGVSGGFVSRGVLRSRGESRPIRRRPRPEAVIVRVVRPAVGRAPHSIPPVTLLASGAPTHGAFLARIGPRATPDFCPAVRTRRPLGSMRRIGTLQKSKSGPCVGGHVSDCPPAASIVDVSIVRRQLFGPPHLARIEDRRRSRRSLTAAGGECVAGRHTGCSCAHRSTEPTRRSHLPDPQSWVPADVFLVRTSGSECADAQTCAPVFASYATTPWNCSIH